jgi:amidase
MKRCRSLLLVATLAWLCGACARSVDDEIVQLGAIDLRDEIAAGHLSALQVTEAFLQRIAALDDAGPELRAVLEVNPEAEAIARALDGHRSSGAALGPLHGVPVLIKANIDTADAMTTSAGSLALAEHRASRDADVVATLRTAGAVIIGKTNLSEWANFRSTASTSGWSSLGGQTRNPYVLDRNPCGSSSGSAVAIAARLAPLAIGTETDGSIVCPAGVNGVVGLKPTHGLVSGRGVVPLAASQDTIGPLARSVADVALLQSVLAGTEPSIGVAHDQPEIVGLRIGVVRDHQRIGSDATVDVAFERSLLRLRSAGAVLVDPVIVGLSLATERAEMLVLLAEFAEQIDIYLADVARGPRTLDELIAFNEAHAVEVMPHFGQELLLAARASRGTDNDLYRGAVAALAAARVALSGVFTEHALDALVAPTNARAWRIDYAAGDAVGVGSSRFAAIAGYPSVSVPAELSSDLPLGISFIGKPNQERSLLALAAVFERSRGPFPAPRFLRSIAQ